MSRVLISDLDSASLARLKQRAARHGRSIECEAAAILSQALGAADSWSRTSELRDELARSGRQFPDSTDLIREVRAR